MPQPFWDRLDKRAEIASALCWWWHLGRRKLSANAARIPQPLGSELGLGADSGALVFFAWTPRVRSGKTCFSAEVQWQGHETHAKRRSTASLSLSNERPLAGQDLASPPGGCCLIVVFARNRDLALRRGTWPR